MSQTDALQDFETPQERLRRRYGVLRIFVNSVSFAKGAAYTIPNVNDGNGQPFQFKGKQLGGNQTHIVLQLTCETQTGDEYTIVKDCMSSDPKNGEPFKNILRPSLVKNFGQHYGAIVGKPLHVAVEEVAFGEPYTGTDRESGLPVERQKKMWRIVEVFGNRDERKVAESKYFAAFSIEKNNSEVPAQALPDAEVMLQLVSLYDTIAESVADESVRDETFLSQVTGTSEMEGHNPAIALSEIKRVKAGRGF